MQKSCVRKNSALFLYGGEIIKVEENYYSIKKDDEIASECEEIILA